MKSKRLIKVIALTLGILSTFGTFYQASDSSIPGLLQTANAETGTEVTVNNINYMVYSDHAEVKTGTSSASGSPSATGDIIIESEVNGVPVTAVGDYAFCDNYSITGVSIPNSVNTIGSCAFKGCNKITDIKIPSSVTSLGRICFGYCTNLKSFSADNGITSIPDWAFTNCTSLKDVKLPYSVTKINQWAFKNCSSLENLKLPNQLKTIDACFIGGTAIKSLVLPKSVTKLSNSPFGSADNLEFVDIQGGADVEFLNSFNTPSSLKVIKVTQELYSDDLYDRRLPLYVVLYSPEEDVVGYYWVASRTTNFKTYANEIGTGWTRISGSPIGNITSDSEYKCSSLVTNTKIDTPNLVTANTVNQNRKTNVEISIN